MATALFPVIGLEVHVQLGTATKLFCADRVEHGGRPNTRVCPVCLGLPGGLPTLNGAAVELAVRAAVGLGCRVHGRSAFARKSYAYPDLPKGYQITQHDEPLATGGGLAIEGADGPRRIAIRRLHLEEDTGRSLHDGQAQGTGLDFNRAGVPLIEIVTEPEIRNAREARAFLLRLRQALRYLGVSECAMEWGGLRVDANVSIRSERGAPGTRTEIKNLNSFSGVERAIEEEVARQILVHERGGSVDALTLLWDADARELRPMRGKGSASEYRYLPEPDIPALELRPELIGRARSSMPEMPWERAARYRDRFGLSPARAEALTAQRPVADYYEAVLASGADPVETASWVLREVLGAARAAGCEVQHAGVAPQRLAQLVKLVSARSISRTTAARLFELMLDSDASPDELAAREGIGLESDPELTRAWVEAALTQSPDEAQRLATGDLRLIHYFVGRAMAASAGRGNPRAIQELLRRRFAG